MERTTLRNRSDIPRRDRWDLSPLFQFNAEWEALFRELSERIEGYDEHRGRMGASADALRAAVAFDLEMSRGLERLYAYAHLKFDEDQGNQTHLAMHERAIGLHTRAAERSSFMRPELMAIDPDTMERFLADPGLAPFRFYLEKILRYRPYTLTAAEENLMAMGREMAQTAGQVFRQLDNVDLAFGEIADEKGRTLELTHGNFVSLLQSTDRNVRRNTFHQYYDAYHRHRHTLAAALSGSIKADLFYARARGYPSCRSAALFPDRIPESVYDNLIASVREGLPVLFRYLDLRKRALGLESLHIYDTYVPIVGNVEFDMPFEAAVELCVDALAPLGDDYTGQLKEGLLGGWVDRYENRGKRSGAYSSGCYDSPPYILLNHQPSNINSLYTLAHEAGHSMHSLFSKRRQSYADHGYSIFVAEVASTFNEILLSRHLLRRYADEPKTVAFILNREIDNIRATLYRQTMFAEFEHRVHEVAEKKEALTLEGMTGIYRQLLEGYFGDRMVIDPPLALECLRIPHFYSAFYVYKYATGISAAIALARGVVEERSGAVEAYLDFLSKGGSQYPLDQLSGAGVDMASPEPVREAVAHFEELVGDFASALERLRS